MPKYINVSLDGPDLSPESAAIIERLRRNRQAVDNDAKEFDRQDEQNVLEFAADAEKKYGTLGKGDRVEVLVRLFRAKPGKLTQQHFKEMLDWFDRSDPTPEERRRVTSALEAATKRRKIPKHLRRMYCKRQRKNVTR